MGCGAARERVTAHTSPNVATSQSTRGTGSQSTVKTRWADGSRIERVPLAPAGAEPFVFLAGRSAAEGAPDAGAIGGRGFSLGRARESNTVLNHIKSVPVKPIRSVP